MRTIAAAGNRGKGGRQLWAEASVVFVAAMGFLGALAPSAPFSKELGVCESGAVRDILAGNVILPRFLPGPMVHVPPLYWWLAALCVKVLGWNELALRLPSLAAAALTCAIVFAWTACTIGRRAGVWSAATLLCCHFFLDAARQPRMDSMLALFVSAAAISLERAIAVRAASKTRAGTGASAAIIAGSRATWFCAGASAIGLGALTKGILGIVLPGLALALFLLVRRRFEELFRGWVVATFAAGSAIGLWWFVAGWSLGGGAFLDWQVRMNLWSRFIPSAAGGAGYCAHPFWYFGPQILAGFLPWSIYLPAFALAAWRRAHTQLPNGIVYALCWFAALFIFFSLSQGKCQVYILPAFSPLAILAGWTIAEVHSEHCLGEQGSKRDSKDEGEPQRHKLDADNATGGESSHRDSLSARLRWPQRMLQSLNVADALFGLGSVIIAAGSSMIVIATLLVARYGLPAKILSQLHPTDRRFVELLGGYGLKPSLITWAIISCAGAGLLIVGLQRRRPGLQGVGTLAVAAAGAWFWFAVMNPALAERETLKPFAHGVAAIVPRDARIGHFGLGDCELNFYSPRPLEPLPHLSCSDKVTQPYVVIRGRDFDAIAPARRSCFTIVLESHPGDSIGARLLLKHRGQ